MMNCVDFMAGLDAISDRYLSATETLKPGASIWIRHGRGRRVAIVSRITDGGMIEARTCDVRGFHAPKIIDAFDFVRVL